MELFHDNVCIILVLHEAEKLESGFGLFGLDPCSAKWWGDIKYTRVRNDPLHPTLTLMIRGWFSPQFFIWNEFGSFFKWNEAFPDSLCGKMKSSSEYFVNIYWSFWKNLHQQSYKKYLWHQLNPYLKIIVNKISKNKRNDPKMTSAHFQLQVMELRNFLEKYFWISKNK